MTLGVVVVMVMMVVLTPSTDQRRQLMMQLFADQGPCPSSKLWFVFKMSDYDDTGSGGDDGDDGGTDNLH